MELDGPIFKGKELNIKLMIKVFKICEKEEWESVKNNDFFEGSKIDQIDGFIHLSTSEQVKETLKKHFTSKNKLYLLEINADDLKLVWEVSRNNQIFPHLYEPLPLDAVTRIYRVFMDTNGNHIIPKLIYDD